MFTPRPLASRSIPGFHLPRIHESTALGAFAALLVILIALALPAYPRLTEFRSEAIQSLPNVLAPLVILALFIERAVEVVISGWRRAGALERETEFRRARSTGDVDSQWEARIRLDAYTSESQRTAMVAAFALSLLVSMMGVRAIEMLVAQDLVPQTAAFQQKLFVRVDVVLTALLLTGGAEGIHKVVAAFTSFVEMTKERIDQPSAERGNAEA